MARNVEIKARLADYQTQLDLSKSLCGGLGQPIHQVDVYFRCDAGRLKLRLFDDGHGELIFYRRASESGPKLSEYYISHTDNPDTLRETLDRAYGTRAIVEKNRLLFLHNRTRIHFDQVKDLGNFLELEVVMKDDEDVEAGRQEADALMKSLQIDPDSLLQCAYVDLLEQSQG